MIPRCRRATKVGSGKPPSTTVSGTTAHDRHMTTFRAHGFVRTSTDRQAFDRQVDALLAAGVDREHIVIEAGVSGQATKRQGLDELMLPVRPGDAVLVAELSRLGRSTRQVLELVSRLTEAGCTVRSLQPSLVFDGSPVGTLLLTLLAAVAELEVETLRARTRDGLAAARARGRVGGRPARLTEAQRRTVAQLRAEGKPARELAEVFGVSLRTIYRSAAGS